MTTGRENEKTDTPAKKGVMTEDGIETEGIAETEGTGETGKIEDWQGVMLDAMMGIGLLGESATCLRTGVLVAGVVGVGAFRTVTPSQCKRAETERKV